MSIDYIETLDEFETEYRKGIGTVLPYRLSKQANIDNIRRYGDGVGDYNPLYRDEQHAAASRFGMIIAPPTFLYAVTLGVIAGETGAIDRARVNTQHLPVNYAGAEIEFVRPVRRDDVLTATETVGETKRKTSKRIGPNNFNTGLVTFTNQRKEIVATVKTLMARYQNMGHTLEYDREDKESDSERRTITPADPLVHERNRRGSDKLFWEDVIEGEPMPELPKGNIFCYRVVSVYTRCNGNRKKLESRT